MLQDATRCDKSAHCNKVTSKTEGGDARNSVIRNSTWSTWSPKKSRSESLGITVKWLQVGLIVQLCLSMLHGNGKGQSRVYQGTSMSHHRGCCKVAQLVRLFLNFCHIEKGPPCSQSVVQMLGKPNPGRINEAWLSSVIWSCKQPTRPVLGCPTSSLISVSCLRFTSHMKRVSMICGIYPSSVSKSIGKLIFTGGNTQSWWKT